MCEHVCNACSNHKRERRTRCRSICSLKAHDLRDLLENGARRRNVRQLQLQQLRSALLTVVTEGVTLGVDDDEGVMEALALLLGVMLAVPELLGVVEDVEDGEAVTDAVELAEGVSELDTDGDVVDVAVIDGVLLLLAVALPVTLEVAVMDEDDDGEELIDAVAEEVCNQGKRSCSQQN